MTSFSNSNSAVVLLQKTFGFYSAFAFSDTVKYFLLAVKYYKCETRNPVILCVFGEEIVNLQRKP